MPQITVTADASSDSEDRAVLLRERVNVADFESHHFATQLVERLGWAVGDAHELERAEAPAESGRHATPAAAHRRSTFARDATSARRAS